MSEREPYPSEKQDRFIVRLPDGMRDRIKAAAEANNRSMNAEIVATLEREYPAPPSVSELLQSATVVADQIEALLHEGPTREDLSHTDSGRARLILRQLRALAMHLDESSRIKR